MEASIQKKIEDLVRKDSEHNWGNVVIAQVKRDNPECKDPAELDKLIEAWRKEYKRKNKR